MNITSFGLGIEAKETSAEVLGGKGAGLVWMDKQGVPVPPGFIIPTTVCALSYMSNPKGTMAAVAQSIKPWMKKLEEKFGYAPLVSVRSGARQSMPGMMDTILNVGLDETNAEAWIERLGEKCVMDSRRRLIEMYGSVVQGIERHKFENLSAAEARDLYRHHTGKNFPQAWEQLLGSIEAVFKSWNNPRAKTYRKMNNIPEDWGTAVTVQAMVFGNMNENSATGVLFTRNPDTGVKGIMGEYLENAQGEDVVAGIRTPKGIALMKSWNPGIWVQLEGIVLKLEAEQKDVQDVEFTVQDGKLYILQTRNAKRSAVAAIRIAVDLHKEGVLTEKEVFKRVSYLEYVKAQVPTLDPSFKKKPWAKGLPACSGIATGIVVFTAKEAEASKVPVILVTNETNPDDIGGMAKAAGVLTMKGGATSHAAVVARGMNRVCVVGLQKELSEFTAGETLSLDGGTGRVWRSEVPVINGASTPEIETLNAMMKGALPQVRVIGETHGDVLDVSAMTVDQAKATVLNMLKIQPTVIVDTRKPVNSAQEAFDLLFSSGEEEFNMVQAIHHATGGKAKFMTNAKVAGIQAIRSVKTPEDFVMAEGDFILDVPSAPWVEKLIAMKAKLENAKPMLLGVVAEGGYLSMPQMAHALLR